MGRPRRNPDESRHGKFKEGTVQTHFVSDVETKAILIYSAAVSGKTVKSLLVGEAMKFAKSIGVIDEDGRVTEKHQPGVSLTIDLVKAKMGE